MRRLALPAASVLLALLAAAPAAQATFKGGNGRLAYDIHQTGLADDGTTPTGYRALSTVQPDGRVDRFLRECQTTGATIFEGDCAIDYRSPSWRRDGKQLVFSTGKALALIGPTGSGFSVLPSVTRADGQPAFAPSGKRVAFAGRDGVYVYDLAARRAKRILARAADPDWSSSNRIAFERGGSIWTTSASGGGAKRVARGSDPSWSPTGRVLIYARRGGIYTVSAKGGRAKRVVRCSRCTGPVFSPTGRQFAYDRGGPLIADLKTGRSDGKPLVQDVSGGGEKFDASNISWGVK